MTDDTSHHAGVGAGVRQDDSARPSTLAHEALLATLKTWFRDDAAHSARWRKTAREDFDFVAGEQWTAEERAVLEGQLRPVIVFNRTLSVIKAVAGSEINTRHDIRFIPRHNADSAVNEVLTGASRWMADGCDAEDEESEAFQHTIICGMGFTEARLDYERDPDGEYVEECISPLEMYWDRTARKKNLADARRIWRVRRMPIDEARALFPDCDDGAFDAAWARAGEIGDPARSEEDKRRREDNASGAVEDCHEVTIVQCQWWEREPYWLVADPVTNARVAMDEAEHATLVARARQLGIVTGRSGQIAGVKLCRRVYKQAFVGAEVLEVGPAPCGEHFSFTCITGEPDPNARTWFGLTRVMRDPQKWANKWLSQTLHILNASAKGGILAETDAFEDQRQAEDSYARPEAITWMRRGALSGAGGQKFVPKPTAQFPVGYFNLMEFGISSIRDVTGINLELLGQRDANQPGILEAQRKQAAMTVLATMFDSLRRFRKIVGRIRLYFIQNFLADGRLIRITGPDGARVIPLLRDATLGRYDVIVDDAPTSPNQKEVNWAIISAMLPAFRDQLLARPELIAAILDYSPLPSALVEKLKAAALVPTAPPDPQQTQQAQQAQRLAEAAAVARINRDQAAAEKDLATAGKAQTQAVYDLAMAEKLYADAHRTQVGADL